MRRGCRGGESPVFELFTTKATAAAAAWGWSMVYGFVRQSGGAVGMERVRAGTSRRLHAASVDRG